MSDSLSEGRSKSGGGEVAIIVRQWPTTAPSSWSRDYLQTCVNAETNAEYAYQLTPFRNLILGVPGKPRDSVNSPTGSSLNIVLSLWRCTERTYDTKAFGVHVSQVDEDGT